MEQKLLSRGLTAIRKRAKDSLEMTREMLSVELDGQWLMEEAENAVCNLATVIYLEEWLENDSNATQTINSFAYQPYRLQSEAKCKRDLIREAEQESYVKALREAEATYKSMHEQREKQAEAEDAIKQPLNEKGSNRAGRPYDFITLRFMELYAPSNNYPRRLSIFDLLALRKHLMSVTSDKGGYNSLSRAYEDYYNIFKDIKDMDARRYVVASMQIHKLEMTYHYHLFLLLAKWMEDCSDKETKQRLMDIAPLWARYKYSIPLNLSGECTEKKYEDQPYDILSYMDLMRLLLREEGKTGSNYFVEYRRILLITVMQMNATMPVREQPSWTDQDFSDAEQFFREAYPIAEKYASVDFEEVNKKEYLKRLVEIYQVVEEIGKQKKASPSFTDFRKSMQEKRKERNTRKDK